MEEEGAMQKKPEARWNHRLDAWSKTIVDKDQHYLELEMLMLALASGIIDAVTFPSSTATGNTVLFAVTAFSVFGTRQDTSFQVLAPHLAVSLGFFCIGVFVAGQLSNRFDCKFSRWWLLFTNIVQSSMVLIVALLNYVFDTTDKVSTAPILCSVGLLALSAGAQVAMSRQLQMPEIPTTQATAAYVDLFVDPKFFAPAYHYVSTAFAVFLAGLVKIVVCVMLMFNSSKEEEPKLP